MIVFRMDAQGGFTAGDTVTRLTAYCYPTSFNAVIARKQPERIAHELIKGAKLFATLDRADYDARNWATLSSEQVRS